MNINVEWQWQRKTEVLAKGPDAQDVQVGFVAEWKKKNFWWGRPVKAGRLKIFALNRKDWLLVANWLWLGDNDNIEKYNNIHNIVRPLPDLRVPLICTGFHPSRRHCWYSVTNRLSSFNPYSNCVIQGTDKVHQRQQFQRESHIRTTN